MANFGKSHCTNLKIALFHIFYKNKENFFKNPLTFYFFSFIIFMYLGGADNIRNRLACHFLFKETSRKIKNFVLLDDFYFLYSRMFQVTFYSSAKVVKRNVAFYVKYNVFCLTVALP